MIALIVGGLGASLLAVFWRAPTESDAPADIEVSPVTTDVTNDSRAIDAVVPTLDPNWQAIDDPARDGWDSEVAAQQVSEILNTLGTTLFGDVLSPDEVLNFPSADYQGGWLVPPKLETVFSTATIEVRRRSSSASSSAVDFEASVQAVRDFWEPFTDRRFEFKLVRVVEREDQLETKQFLAVSGQSAGNVIEQHATWVIHWRRLPPQSPRPLQIVSIEIVEFEETRATHKLFAEGTPAVLGANGSYDRQFLFGLNHWLERIQDMRYFSPLGTPGLSVADVNGDGLEDLYVCQEANLPNRLFLQQADGTAIDVSAAWQVDFLEGSRSALLVDLDNDGDQDLVVAIMGGLVLAANETDRFVVRDVIKTNDDTTSLTAADYDLDGDLDLYVCVDYPNEFYAAADDYEGDGIVVQGGAANRVYHDANNAGANSLIRNDTTSPSDWNFSDVTEETGVDENNRRFTWAACWEDYDNDGDQDLYVANDFGRNNLYRNDGGRFTDVAKLAGVEDSAAGMSAAWGDFDRDGNFDIYVANMFSSAGSRITEQPDFKRDVDPELKSRWRQFAAGNTLFRNLGDDQFEDVSDRAAVTLGRWSWSSNFVDVNNDGWQDLAVANGYITSYDNGDL